MVQLNYKIILLKKNLFRFSRFEQKFIRGIEKKKEPLSSRQESLLSELYERYQSQLRFRETNPL